jgi:transcriptional regulator with XRE-family HTH domain
MKKVRLDGKQIKRMREARDRGSTQKELAHETRISERMLRLIENRNAAVSVAVAERLARSLGQPAAALMVQQCATFGRARVRPHPRACRRKSN